MRRHFFVGILVILSAWAEAEILVPVAGPPEVAAQYPALDCRGIYMFNVRRAGDHYFASWDDLTIEGVSNVMVPMYAYSDDGGYTWSDVVVNGEKNILPMSDGRWMKLGSQLVGEVQQAGVWFAEDRIPTWGDFRALMPTVAAEHSGVKLLDVDEGSDGMLYVLAWVSGSTGYDDRIDLCRSADSGQTWLPPVTVASAEIIYSCGACSWLEQLPEGRLFVQWEDGEDRYSISDDGGETWSMPRIRLDATVLRAPDKLVGYTHVGIVKQTTSLDNGATWTPANPDLAVGFDSGIGAGNDSAISSAADDAGNVLLLFGTDDFHGNHLLYQYTTGTPVPVSSGHYADVLVGMEEGWLLVSLDSAGPEGNAMERLMVRRIALETVEDSETKGETEPLSWSAAKAITTSGPPAGIPNYTYASVTTSVRSVAAVAPQTWLALGGYTASEMNRVYTRPPYYDDIPTGRSWEAPLFARTTDVAAGWPASELWLPGQAYANTSAPKRYLLDSVADGKGAVVVCYAEGGQPFVRVSRDFGSTWSDSIALSENAVASTFAGARGITDTQGHWALFLWGTSESYVAYSTDDAATWQLTSLPVYRPTASAIGDGSFVLTYSPKTAAGGGDLDVQVARSTDYGASWSTPVPLDSGAAVDERDDVNPVVAGGTQGHVVAAWSAAADCRLPADVYTAWSNDGGLSWSLPVLLSGEDSAAVESEVATSVLHLGGPRFFIAWSHTDGDLGVFSHDHGVTWTSPRQLLPWSAASNAPAPIQADYYRTDKHGQIVAVEGNKSRLLAYDFGVFAEGEGEVEGVTEGVHEGDSDGTVEGVTDGGNEGLVDGEPDGMSEGMQEGGPEGVVEGRQEGLAEGQVEGLEEGANEGEGDGMVEGNMDGEAPLEGEGQFEAEGDVEGEAASHRADLDADGHFSLTELLRCIQLYNAEAFHCMQGEEDGYAIGAGNVLCPPHSADYLPQDWVLNLSELLRMIQLYNAGSYHPCPGKGEGDGFCTGTA